MQTIHGRMAKTALRSFKVINKIDNNLAAVYYAGSILWFQIYTNIFLSYFKRFQNE